LTLNLGGDDTAGDDDAASSDAASTSRASTAPGYTDSPSDAGSCPFPRGRPESSLV